jgi:acyl-CoA synthetase (NDP forming)
MTSRRSLKPLFEPGSIAVVGASAVVGKWGNILSQTLIKGAHRRKIFLINRRGESILGQRTFASLLDLPEPPDLVFLVVPASGFETAIDEALKVGAKAIVALTAGLGETGDENKAREASAVKKIRAAGAVMVGPNCMGVIDTESELFGAAHMTLPAGDIAVITQSGGIGMELGCRAASSGIGFSRFISLGNQADLKAPDFIRELANHDQTRVIAMYLEDTGNGRELLQAAQLAHNNGKRLILLSPGLSEAVGRATLSHTGSMASSDDSINALCEAGGIVRVHTPRELFDAAAAFRYARIPKGRRLAIISDGGGAAIVASALVGSRGFEVPPFSDELAGSIAESVSEMASVGNPVDLLADDPSAFYHCVNLVVESGEVDAILMTGVYGHTASKQYPEELGDLSELEKAEVETATLIGQTAKAKSIPIVASTITTPSPVIGELARFGVPMYGNIEAAVSSLERLCFVGETIVNDLALPTPTSTPVTDDSYEGSRQFLTDTGISFPNARFVSTLDEALAAGEALNYPLVLKALGLLHKSDSGGVAVGLKDSTALKGAFRNMDERLQPKRFSVEEMAPLSDGVELIVGTRWDEKLGPMLLVGMGGIFTEQLKDVRLALAPVTEEIVLQMLNSLQGIEILRGARGRSAVNLDEIAKLATTVSEVAASHPEIIEMEMNPVLALPDRAIGLDARIILSG